MAKLQQSTADALAAIVGARRVLSGPQELLAYGGDRSRVSRPDPLAVVLPGCVQEVQALVRLAAGAGLALVPSGGRTGLSGGAVAGAGELVVALDRLDQIADFDPVDRTVRCGAGVVTARLQAFASERDLSYPVDFASSGSSQIGGNIATNAGGIKVIRHGMTRDHVAGLKLVTGTGELLDLNRGLRKNNAGYDLRHLVIGAEGTLGIVVEATLRLSPPPPELAVLVLGVPDLRAVMRLLSLSRETLDLWAFEFFCAQSLARVLAARDLAPPLDRPAPYYCLLEFECAGEAGEQQALALFEQGLARGWVLDGVVSHSVAQARALWRLREEISESIAPFTPYKNDISVVVSEVPELLRELQVLLRRHCPDYTVLWYGHIGDGNLHLNILKPAGCPEADFERDCEAVSDQVYDIVRKLGGSVSAEHGIGLLKKDYLGHSCGPAEIELMRGIRRVFDPHGIMNPGKLFD